VEIREAAIAAMGQAELEELIDRAVRPDVPLRVLFAALDRYTELLRPVLDDEPAPAPATAATAATAAPSAESSPMVLPVTPGPRPTGPPGPPE
jgi:hypothetical protein